jgi:D-glycero-D-manno-heptose 1,7-bisphosphate phosphatase
VKPCVFFDRDGVVNRSPGEGYVLRWEDFHFNDGLFELLRLVKQRGYLAVLVTSQKGVGKGLMFHVELLRIHREMQQRLGLECGSGFDAIYAHTGEADCPYPAKPDPEMIYAAARDCDIDLSRSWMIGDADRDIEMGQGAGLAGTLRLVGDKAVAVVADETVADLGEALQVFERVLEPIA